MNFKNLIDINPAIRAGKPCVVGTRIAVGDVLEYMASGMTEAQICHDFPELTPEHIHACFAFAAGRERLIHHTAL